MRLLAYLHDEDHVYPVIESDDHTDILAEFGRNARFAITEAQRVMYSLNLGMDMAEIGDTQ